MKKKRSLYIAAVATAAFIVGRATRLPQGPSWAPSTSRTRLPVGDVDGQDGWSKRRPVRPRVDDQATSLSEPDDFGLGEQSLRLSNAVTSGSFGNQTISPSTGTTPARPGDRGYFETSWKFATAGNPLAEQEDLVVSSSPDNGSGSRISFVQMADCSAGEAQHLLACLASRLPACEPGRLRGALHAPRGGSGARRRSAQLRRRGQRALRRGRRGHRGHHRGIRRGHQRDRRRGAGDRARNRRPQDRY